MKNRSRDTLVMNGIHNHGSSRAKDDFYATQPIATEQLVSLEDLGGCTILEPCCGTGHISKVLTDHGLDVVSSDIVDRGFGKVQDFFSIPSWDGHIVTNPPYTHAQECVQHALDIIPDGRLACFFLKLTFLEGIRRRRMFDSSPPIRIWVSTSRVVCAPNADFASVRGSAVAYAWFIWQKGYQGPPTLGWFNPL